MAHKTEKAAIAVCVFAAAVFGGQVVGGALTGGLKSHGPIVTTTTTTACAEDDPCWDCRTMGNHVCGPVSSPDPWPDCAAACHSDQAAAAVDQAAAQAGPGYVCWAEDNASQPGGYEVLCRDDRP